MSSKILAQRILAFLMIIGLMLTTGACGLNSNSLGQAVTPTLPGSQANTPSADATATIPPSPTPTEIPILLPTPTVVGGLTPPPTNNLLPPTVAPSPTLSPTVTATPKPTVTPTNTPLPRPTDTPKPTATPALAVRTYALVDERSTFGFIFPSAVEYPALTNSCIASTLLNPVRVTPGSESSLVADLEPRYWAQYTYDTYIRKATVGEDLLQTQSILFITNTVLAKVPLNNSYSDLVMIWNVMPNIGLQLANPDTDANSYLRAYETALNTFINSTLSQTQAKIVIGNVINIQDMRFFRPCFSRDTLQSVQNSYNQMIGNMVAKNPKRVFIADLTGLDIANQQLFTSLNNGYFLTQSGYQAIADSFGKVINNQLGITKPIRPVSLNNTPTKLPYTGGDTSSGGGGGGGGSGGGSGGTPVATTAASGTPAPIPTVKP